jgi:hypothetical protein
MGWTKISDLAVKTGEYEKDGETKGRYENVGSMWENDEGEQMLSLKRTFNPAGVPNPGDRDSVIISMFEPRQQNGGGNSGNSRDSGNSRGQQLEQSRGSKPAPRRDEGDDIPF